VTLNPNQNDDDVQLADDPQEGRGVMTTSYHNQDDAQLTAQIIDVQKSIEAIDVTKEEKHKVLGRLLAEAHDRHPSDAAFAIFLKQCEGVYIEIRWAKQLIAFALGTKDLEKHKADNAAANKKLRDRQKAEKKAAAKLVGGPVAKPKKATPPPFKSVTTLIKAKPDVSRDASPGGTTALAKPVSVLTPKTSRAFNDFVYACKTYLPQMSEVEVATAQTFVASYVFERKAAPMVAS
jgi:hypothetical protein